MEDREELLRIARGRYPQGTNIKSAFSGENKVINSTSFAITKDNNIHNGITYVRWLQKWAEVVSLPEPKEIYFPIFN